ncbi:NAD(P)/FAD-dependent oxidoreductase [Paractinoplanes hotanensis]|uniref:NAD(P)/FAD-dependent oxidoreductase n=1 Tax=Paractinoplanes hotanensis TaxID=2906497 RepID=A0ABT0Y2T5_9ACTN|nr:NAD(P)/FAD-dependent oxidoreductase [Actinoplanes hotanensis]MCM4080348.1 NAD(P)/FAD-dependent oxidoreductase [Actinoplanes hotanensis]
MTYDVIVIGGGPAGLSGAVALGRALRSVLVIDSGQGRNAPAEGIHNFLTRDGMSPAEFRAAGRAEVEKYGGRVIDGEVVSAVPGFEVALADGSVHRARRLLVTAGVVDLLPDVPGLAEGWGSTVLHCPYCHGYEVRGKAIGVIGMPGEEQTGHKMRLWSQWSPDVRLLELDRIAAVEPGGVRMTDGSLVARDYLVVTTRIEARAGFLGTLGLEAVEHPMGIGTYVPATDPTGRTAVDGVWVAGNVADPMAQVISAAAAGLTAGAMINADLLPPAPDKP